MSVSSIDDYLQRSAFDTRDGDQITHFLRVQYVDNDIRFDTADRDPRFRSAMVATSDLAGDLIRSSIDYGGTCDPFDYYLFYVCRNGRMRVDSAAGAQRLVPGDATFFPPGVPLDFDFRDVGIETLRLPRGRLEQSAEQLTGVPAAQVRFDGLEPVSAAAHRRWSSTFAFISNSLTAPDGPSCSPLVTGQFAHLLAAVALESFPNTAVNRHHSAGPGKVDPAALRRAVDYIDTNADQPLTLADIAAAAGTTGRALQYAFRKHRGTTPLGHVRRVRLERAHQDLQTADPANGDTVSDIAARWGFINPGRFATAYRHAYGQPPSHTLRR